MLKLPKGTSDFKSIIDEKFFIVDKTFLIKEIIDDVCRVILLPRPRRFGKTTNMSMLHYFFDCVDAEANKHLFKDLNIARAGKAYLKHQGQYPTVFLSLKSAGASDFSTNMRIIANLMQACYSKHAYLIDSDQLLPNEKEVVQKILDLKADDAVLRQSLVFLTRVLKQHHKKPVVLIVDEYDAPLHAGFTSGMEHLEHMIDFMRGFFGEALKDNNVLFKAVITGILQIGQASLFSGLNNIHASSILEPEYSDCFGFTQSEVDNLFQKAQIPYNREEIKRWYNGYCIGGNTTVYNPWSIISCILKRGQIAAYWLETGEYGLVGTALEGHRKRSIFKDLKLLIEGGTITKTISIRTILHDISKDETALWTLIFFAGYLTVHECKMLDSGSDYRCVFSSPNREIQGAFARWSQFCYEASMGNDRPYRQFIDSLIVGDMYEFLNGLRHYLSSSISYFDLNKNSEERFYHVFLLGLLAGYRQDYDIESNRESGKGRFDIMLVPQEKEKQIGVVIELKAVDNPEQLDKSAQEALDQIKKHAYADKLRNLNVPRIVMVGLSFCGKEVGMACHSEGFILDI